MKLNYSLKNKPAVTRSTITASTANKALFILIRETLLNLRLAMETDMILRLRYIRQKT